MKRLLFLALAITAVALQGFCEDTENWYYETNTSGQEVPRKFLGIRANLDITAPGDATADGIGIELFEPGAGFSAGLVYNTPLGRKFYFEPGLYLYYQTMGCNKDFLYDVESASVRQFGVRIPLQVGMRFKTRTGFFSISTGPGINIGLSGKLHAEESGQSVNVDVYKDDLNRFDINWNFGCAIHFKQWMIGLNGNMGILNMLKDIDEVKWHQNFITIGFGYNFAI
ncbi:outer membrane beta-barrel protein [uncultured Muribaculum sp.]|uniref:outer membrane beta-barrel protein n=1 Tax=uncultured Muribaculum sp. TaxID=1918613 RepID=UPI00258720B4|nr:outer membrane beta-barrel protein [uncultured Muribaculum sp.]